MDLRALKTFQTVVKAGSFQKAAIELQYVQSTVTMQIKKLEADLGVTLFHRGKKMTLTEAGHFLHQHAKPLLHNVDIVEQAMREISSGDVGVVRVGCIEPTSNQLFPQLVHTFCSSRPHVSMTIEVSSTKKLAERVLAGELDFAICSLLNFSDDYLFEPLFIEPLSLILSREHPLAEKERVEWADLQGERILFASPNCQYRRNFDNVLLQYNQTLPHTMEIASNYELMMQLVMQGLGLAFAPTVYVNQAPDKLVNRSLGDITLDVQVGLLMRSQTLPLGNAAASFAEYIKAHLTR